MTYDEIVTNGTWLESLGPYDRYSCGPENSEYESVWINTETEEVDVYPYD